MTQLTKLPGTLSTFCKYISFHIGQFHTALNVSLQLTVAWTKIGPHLQNVTHDVSAAWSENVTSEGFRACVLVAGRHFFTNGWTNKTPSIQWIAYQTAFVNESEGALESGTVDLQTWYTGSRCAVIDLHVSIIAYIQCLSQLTTYT